MRGETHMSVIFLNLGPRQTGGELLPDAPFRAFVKFNTAYVNGGGCAVLPLEQDEHQIGTAIIDWRETKRYRHPKQGKYLVGTGSLDEIDMQGGQRVPDRQQARLIGQAMEKANWHYLNYDSDLDADTVSSMFDAWINQNL